MLVLSRRVKEKVLFPGIDATVEVLDIKRGVVRLGIQAPPEVAILRAEIQDRAAEWGASAVPAPAPQATNTAPDLSEPLSDRLKDASVLVGVARIQLRLGLTTAVLATLEKLQAELNAVRRTPAPAPGASAPRKALLVEDNDGERELLARFLRQAGIEVDTAGDGADALDYLRRRGTPDVVLMDMGMPRCDGPTAVREIRRDPRTAGLKVFAVSGHQPEEYDLASGPAGVNGWFHKPIDPEALVRCLKAEMAGPRSSR